MNFTKNEAAFEEAKKIIPGGVNSPVRAFKSVGGTPPFIAKGEGAYITDIDGNKYLDYIQSWGPLIFGHADKDIENAVIDAVKSSLSFGAPTLKETELAQEIIEVYPEIEMIRFVSSGTEAVMSALRLARAHSGKNDIIKFKGCYHGHSDSLLVQAGSGAVTFGSPSSPGVPLELASHTLLAELNDIESVKKCFNDSKEGVGAVILEPIAGNMGLVPCDKEFINELRALCDKHGSVLIFDEVMSGFRAGLRGATGYFGVTPDLITLGKVIGGGMPCAAFGGKKEIMQNLSPLGGVYQAGTLSGNPVAMAAGLAQIKKLKANPEIYTKLENLAAKLINGLKEIATENDIPLQTGYIGSMFGFFFCHTPVKSFADALKSDTARFGRFHNAMLKQGVYLAPSQFEAGFICDAMSEETVESTLKAAKIAMKEAK